MLGWSAQIPANCGTRTPLATDCGIEARVRHRAGRGGVALIPEIDGRDAARRFKPNANNSSAFLCPKWSI
jgi:hypothetical protein